ncbi:MAG: aldehyde dehydrogenase family protein [Phycisphaerales bacterium]
MSRVPVAKTCKLYIGGAYPRSESGRSEPIQDPAGVVIAHVARASRKDLRDAVEAAAKASEAWANATPYLRGQILYRIAEFMESRRDELAESIRSVEGSTAAAARREVERSIDRMVSFAGWTDKITSVLGGQCAVSSASYVMATVEPVGVAASIAPPRPSLLGFVTAIAAPLCAGNTVVALASERNPLPAVAMSEILGVSDVPAGVANVLTGGVAEIAPAMASHRQIQALGAIGLEPSLAAAIGEASAESLKRVRFVDLPAERSGLEDAERWTSIDAIAPFTEVKTIWHPASLG